MPRIDDGHGSGPGASDEDGPDPALDRGQERIARHHADLVDAEGRGVVPSAAGGADGDGTGPDHAAVLAALDRTRADLAEHGERVEQRVRAQPTMPPSVLARLDRALADERAAVRTPGSTAASPPGGSRSRRRWAGALASTVAAAALVAVVVFVGVVASGTPGSPPSTPLVAPAPERAEMLPALRTGEAEEALALGLAGDDYGPLADPLRRAECLRAHGIAPDGPQAVPIGAREVTVEGRRAVVLVFTTGIAARFRVLVVGAGCSADTPLTLVDSTVGR